VEREEQQEDIERYESTTGGEDESNGTEQDW
jgi:hypothetical protein